MSETDLVSAILDAFEPDPNVFAWRNNSGATKIGGRFIRFGKKGSPDIIAIVCGRFVGIECKTETGRSSFEQRWFRGKVEAVGGHYLVARSVQDAISACRMIRTGRP